MRISYKDTRKHIFKPHALGFQELLHHLFALDQSAHLRLAAFRANAPRPAFADAAAARTDACLLPFTVTGRPTTRRAAATDLVRAMRLSRARALPDFPRNSLQSAAQQGTLRRCTIKTNTVIHCHMNIKLPLFISRATHSSLGRD